MKRFKGRKTSDQGPLPPHLRGRRGSLEPSVPARLRGADRRMSVANENPTRHLNSALLHITGSSSLLTGSTAGGLAALGVDDDWEPNARPTRSSLPHIGFSARNEDWNSVQQAVLSMFRGERIEPSQLVTLGARVRELSTSDIGPFIYDYYKNQILMKGMRQMREGINKNIENGKGELESIGEAWDYFYREVLPLLHYILHSIATKNLSIKQATLGEFRDNVLLRFEIKDLLEKRKDDIPPNIQQMLLVLQSVPMGEPPSEEYLKLESLVAVVINPYLGYRGLYMGSARPVVSASRTDSTRRKKSTTTAPGRPTSVVVPAITVVPEPSAVRRGLLSVGRQGSQPSMATSMASLTPVAENDGTPEHRRHSFSIV